MTKVYPPDPEKPMLVNSSPIPSMIATGARDLGLVLASSTAILGLIKTGNLAGIIAYLQTQEFISGAAVVVAVAIPIWRQWIARHTAAKLKTLANEVPNAVAMLK